MSLKFVIERLDVSNIFTILLAWDGMFSLVFLNFYNALFQQNNSEMRTHNFSLKIHFIKVIKRFSTLVETITTSSLIFAAVTAVAWYHRGICWIAISFLLQKFFFSDLLWGTLCAFFLFKELYKDKVLDSW